MVHIEVVDPTGAEASAAMAAYYAEIDARFPQGFDPGGAPPPDRFLVARDDGRVVGGVGLVDLGDGIAEMKRMWVADDQRGRGVGRRLVEAIESAARAEVTAGGAPRFHTMRLDTNSHLPEAIALYRSAGYRAIDRYNDNPYPDHFFEKALTEHA